MTETTPCPPFTLMPDTKVVGNDVCFVSVCGTRTSAFLCPADAREHDRHPFVVHI
jgi:hypothetical protein